MESNEYNKILVIADPHGMMEELLEFLKIMDKKHKGTISTCIQLGDFFKGRNVIQGKKIFTFWNKLDFFNDLPFPLFGIKGNEDINIPESWWESGMISLLPNLTEFDLEGYNIIPIYYNDDSPEQLKSLGIKNLVQLQRHLKKKPKTFDSMFDYVSDDKSKVPPVLTNISPVDFVFSHVPPFGLLDKTRDGFTHREIHFTGNRLTRLIIDKRRPKIIFFGHNHFANYQKIGDLMVISCDKFCRKVPYNQNGDFLSRKYDKYSSDDNKEVRERNLFSYCLIIKESDDTIVEMYRRDKLIMKYSMKQHEIVFKSQ